MGQAHRNPVLVMVSAALRWAREHPRRPKRQPPDAGVREPRRPRPTLPAAAVALEEPRTQVRRWIKLVTRRDADLG
jgi:hypothetical protein